MAVFASWDSGGGEKEKRERNVINGERSGRDKLDQGKEEGEMMRGER